MAVSFLAGRVNKKMKNVYFLLKGSQLEWQTPCAPCSPSRPPHFGGWLGVECEPLSQIPASFSIVWFALFTYTWPLSGHESTNTGYLPIPKLTFPVRGPSQRGLEAHLRCPTSLFLGITYTPAHSLICDVRLQSWQLVLVNRRCVFLTPGYGVWAQLRQDRRMLAGQAPAESPGGWWPPAPKVLSRPQHNTGGTPAEGVMCRMKISQCRSTFFLK